MSKNKNQTNTYWGNDFDIHVLVNKGPPFCPIYETFFKSISCVKLNFFHTNFHY